MLLPERKLKYVSEHVLMGRIGKKAAGHLLDGREWREMPGVYK